MSMLMTPEQQALVQRAVKTLDDMHVGHVRPGKAQQVLSDSGVHVPLVVVQAALALRRLRLWQVDP